MFMLLLQIAIGLELLLIVITICLTKAWNKFSACCKELKDCFKNCGKLCDIKLPGDVKIMIVIIIVLSIISFSFSIALFAYGEVSIFYKWSFLVFSFIFILLGFAGCGIPPGPGPRKCYMAFLGFAILVMMVLVIGYFGDLNKTCPSIPGPI